MADDKLIEVEANGSSGVGAKLAISKDVPKVFGALFYRRGLRRDFEQTIALQIKDKILNGKPLDEAELQFAEDVLGANIARYARLKAITSRAEQIYLEEHKSLLLPSGSQSSDAEESRNHSTTDDWISRWRDDAGLVCDEVLSEIYSRLLAYEAARPGNCSLRTLKVLRYLDPQTANLFAKAIPLVIAKAFIPEDRDLLKRFSLDYADILELADAELIQINKVSVRVLGNDDCYPWGEYWVRLENAKDTLLSAYGLTCAGRELTRVAQVERSPDCLRDVMSWFKRGAGNSNVRISWARSQNIVDANDELLKRLDWNLYAPEAQA